jgi:2-aminoethylphosphonate-pyruvate transaminase
VIHCETATGILNPIEEIGAVVARAGASYIVDAMSSFGAIPIHVEAAHVDFLISSANECIEGVAWFRFCPRVPRPVDDLQGPRANSQSRPLRAVGWTGRRGAIPFHVAGANPIGIPPGTDGTGHRRGRSGPAARYHRNHAALAEGMMKMGFQPYLDAEDQSPHHYDLTLSTRSCLPLRRVLYPVKRIGVPHFIRAS